MNIENVLKKMGLNPDAYVNWSKYLNLWVSWYKGKNASFHNYTIYNGIKDVKKERASLQVAKFICEKMADLLYNEKVKITLGNEDSTKILQKVLDDNNFQLKMNRAIEKSFALGTGCIVLDIEDIMVNESVIDYNNSNVKISYVNAENIFPISWDEDGIKELAIVEYNMKSDGTAVCILKMYMLNPRLKYTIYNYKFTIDKNNNIVETPETYLKEFETNTNVPWFAIISPNIVNNIDLYSPYGISIFANSIDVLKGIDLVYDSLNNEINLGRKRLFATKEALRFNSTTGEPQLNFDPNDVVFHVLGDSTLLGDNKNSIIQEINGNLRIDEHLKSLNSQLRILGDKTGFGGDYFAFDEKTLSAKTATEVISENSELFRTIKKHEILLESSLIGIIKAINSIGELTGQFKLDLSQINIDFDDSIIENKSQERSEDRQDLAQDTLSRIDYISKWRGISKEEAVIKAQEIDNEKSANEGIRFIEGEIN